tara:strand:- start:262 stop:531 length:270 start_codon:yes stop_codon:yes gene_type:complete
LRWFELAFRWFATSMEWIYSNSSLSRDFIISNDLSFVFFSLVGVSNLTFTGEMGGGLSSGLALKKVNFLKGRIGEIWFFLTSENCCCNF